MRAPQDQSAAALETVIVDTGQVSRDTRSGMRIAALLLRQLHRFSVVALLVALWEVAARLGWINNQLFPAPTDVAKALIELADLGLLWRDSLASVARVSIGFMFATLAAVAFGALLGRSERLSFYLMPIIDLIRPISVIAWVPLAILWFGLGDRPAWFIIFLGAFFPIFTNTYTAVRAIEPIHIQAAECFGAGRWLFTTHVLIPSTLPLILAGMRVGLGVGWMCVIAAEMIAATSGLGYMIQLARTLLETEKVIAGMVVIAVIGLGMNGLMLLLERQLTPWKRR